METVHLLMFQPSHEMAEHLAVLAPPTLAASVPDTQLGLLAAFTVKCRRVTLHLYVER